MKSFVEGFVQQLREAVEIGENSALNIPNKTIKNVLISGLGGSGIGATTVSKLVEHEAVKPIVINKEYFVPQFVDQHTLVIISSYSGNTEETLSALILALENNAEVVCITSGGKILEIAKERGLNYIQIPSGYPPRAAFAYSSTQLFYVLMRYGIISDDFKSSLNSAMTLLEEHTENIKDEAKAIAEKLVGKIPVLYCAPEFEGAAVRLRQQINENAKMLCWHHIIPEMNHNELVGWREKNDNLAVVFLRNTCDYERVQRRMEINKSIVSQYTSTILEVYSKGNDKIEKTYYHVHLGDWISIFLAKNKGIDAVEVNVIDYLKEELAKV